MISNNLNIISNNLNIISDNLNVISDNLNIVQYFFANSCLVFEHVRFDEDHFAATTGAKHLA